MSKLTKAQQKKLLIRQETDMLNAKRKKQTDAENIQDYLALVPIFRTFNRNGINGTVKSYQHCPPEYREQVFELTSKNMRKMYEETWGWTDANKRSELFEDHARYLIVFIGEKVAGFVHFRFELEGGELNLYVYEIQVDPEFQSKGIGKFMMQAIELIGLKTGMEFVMLTVFKKNEKARRFYTGMHYTVHKSSPVYADPENEDQYFHETLFKSLVKKAAPAQ